MWRKCFSGTVIINNNVELVNLENNLKFKTIAEGQYEINIPRKDIFRLSNSIGKIIKGTFVENQNGSTTIYIKEKGLIFLSFYNQNKIQTIIWNGQ